MSKANPLESITPASGRPAWEACKTCRGSAVCLPASLDPKNWVLRAGSVPCKLCGQAVSFFPLIPNTRFITPAGCPRVTIQRMPNFMDVCPACQAESNRILISLYAKNCKEVIPNAEAKPETEEALVPPVRKA